MRYHGLVPFIAAIPSALAVSPQRPEFTNTTTLPTHFAMMLIPEFQALDVIGPLDVLNTLSMYYKNVTKMHLSVISRSMDPVASTNRTGKGYFGQDILPTTTFQDVLKGGGSCPAAVSENGSGEAPGTANSQGGGYGQGTTEKPQEAPPTGEGSGKGPEGGYGKGYGKREDRTRPAPADEAPLGDIEVLLVPGGGGTRRDMTEEIAFVKTMYPKVSNTPPGHPSAASQLIRLPAKVHHLRLHRLHNPRTRWHPRRQAGHDQQARLGLGRHDGSQRRVGACRALGRGRQHLVVVGHLGWHRRHVCLGL
jgi:hypothetical protein